LHNYKILSLENTATVDALTVVVPKTHVIWDMMLCGWVNSWQHFKGSWCLHHWGQAVQDAL